MSYVIFFPVSRLQITYFNGNSTSYSMGEVKNLRRENQKLKHKLEGIKNEVEEAPFSAKPTV